MTLEALKEQHTSYVRRAIELAELADKQGVQLRILGALSVLIHCPQHRQLMQQLARELTDIDFVGLSSQEKEIEEFFRTQGYLVKGGGVTMELWTGRRIFRHADPREPSVDVFFDCLDFCHKVDFTQRLQLDMPTITMTDLLLEKLQIVEINEKDLKDIIVVLLEHELGDRDEPELVNARYVARRLAEEWGFYYTSERNLDKVRRYAQGYPALSEAQRQRVNAQVDALWMICGAEPKGLAWRVRARVGPRVKWYKDVAEEYRHAPGAQ